MAKRSNAEKYATHFSAFDVSAISKFFFYLDSIIRPDYASQDEDVTKVD
jgi:hypothetical protein